MKLVIKDEFVSDMSTYELLQYGLMNVKHMRNMINQQYKTVLKHQELQYINDLLLEQVMEVMQILVV